MSGGLSLRRKLSGIHDGHRSQASTTIRLRLPALPDAVQKLIYHLGIEISAKGKPNGPSRPVSTYMGSKGTYLYRL